MASFYVVVFALFTAAATGLGALPFAFRRNSTITWLGRANGIASGVMLAASVALLAEGASRNVSRTALGVVTGAVFALAAARALDEGTATRLGRLRGADARKALLIIGVMTAHSAAEGVGVGAAFGDTRGFGILIAIAIAVQNVPEGLAISLVLVPYGTRVRAAACWSVFSSLPQPLLALPAFLFVEQFTAVLPAGLGFAAGAMVWMVGRELLPDAIAQGPRGRVVADTATAFALMLVLQLRLTA
jgi:zinc transporter ZupT